MPADTFSATLGWLQMQTGNDNNSWGSNHNNSVSQIFEDALANVLTESVTGGTLDLSGSPPPAGPTQVRHWMITFTGALAGGQVVKVPNLTKGWWVNNQTTNAFSLQFQTPSGSPSQVIPQGGYTYVWCDGSNNINVSPYSNVGMNLTTGQILGPDGSSALPTHGFVNEVNSGWRRAGTNDIRLSIGGADILQVTGSGASSPNILNLLPSTGSIQINGNQVVPSGVEAPYAGLVAPTGWLFEFGQAVSRSTTANVNLFNAITLTTTGNTNNNTNISNVAIDLRGIGVEGAFIEGTGISLGTTIVAVSTATTLTLSAPASGSSSGITLRILPYGQGDGSTTFNIPDRRGRSLAGRDNMGGTAAARITVSAGTHLATTGGEEVHTLVVGEMPTHNHTLTDPGHTHTYLQFIGQNQSPSGAGFTSGNTSSQNTGSNTTGITLATAGGGGSHNNMQPFGMTNFIIKL